MKKCKAFQHTYSKDGKLYNSCVVCGKLSMYGVGRDGILLHPMFGVKYCRYNRVVDGVTPDPMYRAPKKKKRRKKK